MLGGCPPAASARIAIPIKPATGAGRCLLPARLPACLPARPPACLLISAAYLLWLQVNAMAIYHLLDFGSGFDSMLLAKTGRGGLVGVQWFAV